MGSVSAPEKVFLRWLVGFACVGTALKNAAQFALVEGFCGKCIFSMGKTSLNHIRKFYCKHVYKPGKIHCHSSEANYLNSNPSSSFLLKAKWQHSIQFLA